MRIESVLLLSGASALALPAAAISCSLEGPGGRFSPFAHMMATEADPSQPISTSIAASNYQTVVGDSSSIDAPPTDYNAPPSGLPVVENAPSDTAVLR